MRNIRPWLRRANSLVDIWALFADPDASLEAVKAHYESLCAQPAYLAIPALKKALA